MIIDPVLNVFSPNEVSSHFRICAHPIITFVERIFCLGFSNTSNVDSLDIFRNVVVEKSHNDIENLRRKKHFSIM